MPSKSKALIKDTFLFAIGSFGSKFILFLLVPLYTNFMSKSEYGISELVTSLGQLLVPIVSLSIWEGLIRYALKKETGDEIDR